MTNEITIDVESKADYEGFCIHYKEYEEKGIPIGVKDLSRLAKQYRCEIPIVINGELIFKTI